MLRRVLRLCRVAWGRSIGERPFNFMEVDMSRFILVCDDGEVKEFNYLNEARNYAADLAAEGTTSHLYTHINTFEAEAVDLCAYNCVVPGRDCPITLHV